MLSSDRKKSFEHRLPADPPSDPFHLAKEFFSINWLCITQEFGTFGPAQVFKNLRAENRWTQNNALNDQIKIMNHWSRTNLLNTFNPKDQSWHQQLITRGNKVFKAAQDYLKEL